MTFCGLMEAVFTARDSWNKVFANLFVPFIEPFLKMLNEPLASAECQRLFVVLSGVFAVKPEDKAAREFAKRERKREL